MLGEVPRSAQVSGLSKVRNRRSEHGVRLTRVFHRQVGFDRAVVEDVCLDEDADGEVLVVAARPRKGAMRRCGRCSDEGQQRSVRGRRQRDQSAEGGTRNEAGSTGRLCFGRPATTRRYDSVTRLSTSAGSTSAPARTVIQCFLFMW